MDIVRKQAEYIKKDLSKKMVFIVGPRQVGKTWISKEIMKSYKKPLYLNYDDMDHKKIIKSQSFASGTDLLVLDELHKMRGWKNYLKGLYDTKKEGLHILVTGSARLNAFKKVGDSLAGRYLVHRVLPLSLVELRGTSFELDMDGLMARGGFPELFLSQNKEDERLRKLYIESMLNVDVLDFASVEDLKALHNILYLLRERVGSTVSYKGLSESVGVSPKTVKRYVGILEDLYIIFLIRPHVGKLSRSIQKEPKVYFYDNSLVIGDEGKSLENLIALSLLKEDFFIEDTTGQSIQLAYAKNKQQNEIDFVRIKNGSPYLLIESKLSDFQNINQVKYFTERFGVKGMQLVKNIPVDELHKDGIDIQRADKYLSGLTI